MKRRDLLRWAFRWVRVSYSERLAAMSEKSRPQRLLASVGDLAGSGAQGSVWQVRAPSGEMVRVTTVRGSALLPETPLSEIVSNVVAAARVKRARPDNPMAHGEVHTGFQGVARDLYGAGLGKGWNGQRLARHYLVGFSAGGAVVQDFALSLALDGRTEPLHVVSFGAPVFGDVEWAEQFDGLVKHTRVVLPGDPVPAVVPGGYQHTGQLVTLPAASWPDRVLAREHSHEAYVHALGAL